MKYQGTILEVKAVQEAIQKTRLCWISKETGRTGEPDAGPSTFYTIRLTLEDRKGGIPGFLFFISFNYRHRDDYAELWIKDEDTGRLIKVFPQVLPLFGKLSPIFLPEKAAQVSRDSYQLSHGLRRIT